MNEIRYCVLCSSPRITTETDGRGLITAACEACGAVVLIELAPEDDASLRASIEVLVEPQTSPRRPRRQSIRIVR